MMWEEVMDKKATINVTSRKIQKTEEVKVSVKCGTLNDGTKYLYFEGRDLTGYILLPQDVIEQLTESRK